MNETQSKGNWTELQCISTFIKNGFQCSIPYGNSAKYDFIADINGKLKRFQCKSASNPKLKNSEEKDLSCIQIYTISSTTNTQKTVRHTYTENDIDYFVTYYDNNTYIIPVKECSTLKILRFSPPKNNIEKYNKAEDYVWDKQIEKILKE